MCAPKADPQKLNLFENQLTNNMFGISFEQGTYLKRSSIGLPLALGPLRDKFGVLRKRGGKVSLQDSP